MIERIYLQFFLIIIFLISACSHDDRSLNEVDLLGYNSVKMSILNSILKENPPNDAGGLIVFLGDISNEKARRLLVELTNYYLGSATVEALSYSIVRQGKSILPYLVQELSEPIKCEQASFKNKVTCLSVGDRNLLINSLIRMIKSGKKINYVI